MKWGFQSPLAMASRKTVVTGRVPCHVLKELAEALSSGLRVQGELKGRKISIANQRDEDRLV
jgi:hypothetical protein